MAKYDITHQCGHEWTWNIVGKHSYREWQIERKKEDICPDCWKAQAQAADAALVAASAEAHPDWPELAGSEKQIKWALSLRQQVYDEYASRAKNAKSEADRALFMAALDEAIRVHTDARWYIDHRDMRHTLDDEMRKAIKQMQQEEQAQPAPEPPAPQEQGTWSDEKAQRMHELKLLLAYRPTDDDADLPTLAVLQPLYSEFNGLVFEAAENGVDVETEERRLRVLRSMMQSGRFQR